MTSLPSVTAEEMAGVDRAMVGGLGMDLRQVMEVAGRQVAVFARGYLLGGSAAGRRVAVLCGSGGNGGDGLVAARYLAGWGAEVDVVLSRPLEPRRHGPAAHMAAVLRACGVPTRVAGGAGTGELGSADLGSADLGSADLIVDGLLGFSARSAPEGATAGLIAAANAAAAPTLAIDLPSGLHATTGGLLEPVVRAAATLTLGLPKTGLLAPGAQAVTGEVWVADIGIPEAAYRAVGREVGPVFAGREFVRVG